MRTSSRSQRRACNAGGRRDPMKAQLRVSEAAQLVGVSPSTLRAWESAGLVTPTRQGRYRRFSTSDVKELPRIAAPRAQGAGRWQRRRRGGGGGRTRRRRGREWLAG